MLDCIAICRCMDKKPYGNIYGRLHPNRSFKKCCISPLKRKDNHGKQLYFYNVCKPFRGRIEKAKKTTHYYCNS